MSASAAAPCLSRPEATAIAHAFLPATRFGNRYNYYYVRSKLASDPLYDGICAMLQHSQAPLLDLGCGLGLLAHALRQKGIGLPYRGVDNDAGKIASARQAAGRRALDGVEFAHIDLAMQLPSHSGSVALLDVLQFLPPEAQSRLIDPAIGMLAPGAVLLLRTGLDDGSWRARTTRAVDRFSRWTRWMNAGPRRYPDADDLRARFAAAGGDPRDAPALYLRAAKRLEPLASELAGTAYLMAIASAAHVGGSELEYGPDRVDLPIYNEQLDSMIISGDLCSHICIDGSSNINGSGAGVVVYTPQGNQIEQSIKFTFRASNNEAEYEAIIVGLRLTQILRLTEFEIISDSKLIIGQIT